jgi:hypothetical protein
MDERYIKKCLVCGKMLTKKGFNAHVGNLGRKDRAHHDYAHKVLFYWGAGKRPCHCRHLGNFAHEIIPSNDSILRTPAQLEKHYLVLI